MSNTDPNKSRNLRQQAADLRNPNRRTGPSIHEAEDAAKALESEADKIDCDTFYARHE